MTVSSESSISLRDVCLSFGEVDVLREINATLHPGEYASLTGRSGSGKSSLLNILAGTVYPSSGAVWIGNLDLARRADRLSAHRTSVGYLFQSAHLIGWMSAVENVELGMRYQGVARVERTRRARQALTDVGLGHRLDHRPAELSGGERQRVALARALARRPVLFLADEPTGNLDADTGAHVIELLESVREHAALLLVTHDPAVAARAPLRWILSNGRLAESR